MKKVQVNQTVTNDINRNCLFQVGNQLRYVTSDEEAHRLAKDYPAFALEIVHNNEVIGGTHHENRLHYNFINQYRRNPNFIWGFPNGEMIYKEYMNLIPFVKVYNHQDLIDFGKQIITFASDCEASEETIECLNEALATLVNEYN